MSSLNLYLSFIATAVLVACASVPNLAESDRALYRISSYNIDSTDNDYQIVPIIKQAPYNQWGNWFYGPRDASIDVTVTSVFIPAFRDYATKIVYDSVMDSLISSIFGYKQGSAGDIPYPSLKANFKIKDSITDEIIYYREIKVDGNVSMAKDPCNRKGNSDKEILESMACRLNLQIQDYIIG